MTPVMYSDISGEFPILIAAALIGFVVGGGIGALVSYNDNGVVNASDVFLYGALGTAIGLTAGATWEMFTAYQIASVTAELTFVASMDGDPTNEAIICIDTFKTLEANMKTLGQYRKTGQHLHHIIPKGAAKAAEARDILLRYYSSTESAINGLYMDSGQHAGLHTNLYYDFVNATMRVYSGSVSQVSEGINIIIEYIISGG